MLFIIIFRWIASSVANENLTKMDDVVYNLISSYIRPGITKVMIFVSFLGGAIFLISLSLVLFYILRRVKKHYWDSFFVVFNLSGAWILNNLLKNIYQRQRPTLEHLTRATGYSFPSGHSMIGFAFYGFIAYIIFLNMRGNKYRSLLMIILIFLAFLIGVSRIYLGVHFASDVLGGFVGGAIWIGTCIAAHQSIRYY